MNKFKNVYAKSKSIWIGKTSNIVTRNMKKCVKWCWVMSTVIFTLLIDQSNEIHRRICMPSDVTIKVLILSTWQKTECRSESYFRIHEFRNKDHFTLEHVEVILVSEFMNSETRITFRGFCQTARISFGKTSNVNLHYVMNSPFMCIFIAQDTCSASWFL